MVVFGRDWRDCPSRMRAQWSALQAHGPIAGQQKPRGRLRLMDNTSLHAWREKQCDGAVGCIFSPHFKRAMADVSTTRWVMCSNSWRAGTSLRCRDGQQSPAKLTDSPEMRRGPLARPLRRRPHHSTRALMNESPRRLAQLPHPPGKVISSREPSPSDKSSHCSGSERGRWLSAGQLFQ
jgi:hypothetical protein